MFGEVCKVLFKVEIDYYLEVVVVKNKYRIDGVNIMEYMRVEEVYRYNRDKMIVFKFGIVLNNVFIEVIFYVFLD